LYNMLLIFTAYIVYRLSLTPLHHCNVHCRVSCEKHTVGVVYVLCCSVTQHRLHLCSCPCRICLLCVLQYEELRKQDGQSDSSTNNPASKTQERGKIDRKDFPKKDIAKPERRESMNQYKTTKSVSNVNSNALSEGMNGGANSKFVDTYHVQDMNSLNRQEGFRGGKLDCDQSRPQRNGASRGELHYSSATDLTAPQFYQNEPVNGKLRRRVSGNPKGAVAPRSASSSSSKDESEPRSVSTTLDKFDRTEVTVSLSPSVQPNVCL